MKLKRCFQNQELCVSYPQENQPIHIYAICSYLEVMI